MATRPAARGQRQRLHGPPGEDADEPPVPAEKKSADEIIDELGFGYYQIQLLLICGGSRAAYGSAVQLLAMIQGCIMLEWGLDSVYESILTGSVFAGQIFGMLTLGPLADYYGRRPVILIGWALVVIFGLVSCLATNIWFIIVTETLVGVGLGAIQALTYDLFMEAVPSKFRSRVVYISLFTVLGELYVIAVAWGVLEEYGWRWLAFYSTLPIVVVSITGYFLMEESARWLASQGRNLEADKILTSVAATNGKMGYSTKLKEIAAVAEAEGLESFAELFSPKLWSTTLTLWSVQLLGYFTVYCIFIVLIDFFEDSSDCNYEYGWIFFATLIESFGILGAFGLVGAVGRSVTQGIFWIGTSLLLIGWLTLQLDGQYWPSISFLFFTKVTVSGGAAALWLQSAELYPVALRATGHSAANIMGKLGSFSAVFWVDAYAATDANNFTLGTVIYLIAAFIAGLLALQLRETKNVKLNESDDDSEASERLFEERDGSTPETTNPSTSLLSGSGGVTGNGGSEFSKGKNK